MGESAEQVTSFVLNHMKISDMRPKEDFKVFDQVQVIDRGITGKIMKFDADHRMAWLGNGWWYLKDLEKIKSYSRKDREVNAKDAKETFIYEGLSYLKGTVIFYEGQAIHFRPALDTRLPEFVS